jgi:Uma2 family endonuclease
VSAQPQIPTLAEFAAWEALQEAKHEFAAGRVFAFAGGTKAHAIIAVEIVSVLHARLRGAPCRVYGSDVPIATATVLSESTAATDRGDKLDEYREIATLEEYVLIDSRRRWAEAYRKTGAAWIASLPVSSGDLRFESVDAALALEPLYDLAGVPAT